MIILGINAYHGDAAAAIIKDGELIAAVEEERFNRFKHCAGFPTASVRYCLEAAGVGIEAVDHIGISRDPSAHLHKKILFAATRAAKQVGGKGREQRAKGEVWRGAVVSTVDSGETTHAQDARATAGGNGGGIFRQIKDRLSNAAKVRDLKDELARALSVSKHG